MKSIIDINYLTTPELEIYLSNKKDNFVVFTDFASMESMKSNVHNNLKRNFSIVSRYPKQVIVLKGTRKNIQATLNSNSIPQCLIDMDQTLGFPEFCRKVLLGNDPLLSNILLYREKEAHEYIESLQEGHGLIVEGTYGLSKLYKKSHLMSLREGEHPPEDFLENITQHIIYATEFTCKKHPDVNHMPDQKHIASSYIFRYTASTFFLSLKCIAEGGLKTVSKERLRNDLVDMSYVTYATYFDGLLSKDKKMNDIYHSIIPYLEWTGKYFN